jgi:MarR-like DNA-binding transcriptional regulator SgrR of sgrS sRNA
MQAAAMPVVARSHLVAETLVRLGQDGEPRGWLARAWQHDSDFRRWSFTLRSKVMFHDGTPLTGDVAAPLLAEALKMECTSSGPVVTIRAGKPQPDLLSKLAAPETAIVRDINGAIYGTGPFRVAASEPGRVSLSAFEQYWGGRPYVDSIELTVLPERPSYQPAAADVWQLPVNISRRSLPERIRVWTSEPRELIALSLRGPQAPLREALALSIDRDSIVNVLMQKRGEAAWSLLPQWMAGYAFLFKSAADPVRARQMAASAGRLPPLTISAPARDPVARLVADRIIVNARQAGLAITAVNPDAANLHVERIRLASNDKAAALTQLAAAFGLAIAPPRTIEALYQAESELLQDSRVIPIVFVPDVYGISPRVHGWDQAQAPQDGLLHLEDLWLEP